MSRSRRKQAPRKTCWWIVAGTYGHEVELRAALRSVWQRATAKVSRGCAKQGPIVCLEALRQTALPRMMCHGAGGPFAPSWARHGLPVHIADFQCFTGFSRSTKIVSSEAGALDFLLLICVQYSGSVCGAAAETAKFFSPKAATVRH